MSTVTCDNDVDDEYEEEEILVFVEVDGLLDTEVMDISAPQNPFFKIIGLDTTSPYMQIGKECFVGEYAEMLGTALFFEKDPTPSNRDSTFDAQPDIPLRFVGKTDKHLVMNRVFVNKKNRDKTKPVAKPSYLDAELMRLLPSEMTRDYCDEGQSEEVLKRLSPRHREEQPTAGPSWASDDVPSFPGIHSSTSTAEVSQMIAEQMNIRSDIDLTRARLKYT